MGRSQQWAAWLPDDEPAERPSPPPTPSASSGRSAGAVDSAAELPTRDLPAGAVHGRTTAPSAPAGGWPGPADDARPAGPHRAGLPDPAGHTALPPLPGSLSDETAETSRLVVELFQAIQATRRHADAGPAFLLPSGPGRDRGASRLSAHGIRAAIHVHQHGQRTVGQLAAGLGVSYGWASRVVEELGAAGYLLRERDPRDRRVVLVRLAPGAAADVERAYRWRGDAVQRALGGLDGRQRAGVRSFLRGVIDELARVRGT